MNERFVRRTLLLGAVALTAAPGCGVATGLLDPEFLGALGLGQRSASIPGDAPAVLIAFENRTAREATATISYREGTDRVRTNVFTVQPGRKIAEAFVCPISEVTVGDVSNL